VEIPTLEGTMTARVGDWIITGVKGERYPCKPDIFEATYEPVAATQDPDIAVPERDANRDNIIVLYVDKDCGGPLICDVNAPLPLDVLKDIEDELVKDGGFADLDGAWEITLKVYSCTEQGEYSSCSYWEWSELGRRKIEFPDEDQAAGVRRCRVCGCTDDHACIDTVTCEPCHWVEPDLCSVCADKASQSAGGL